MSLAGTFHALKRPGWLGTPPLESTIVFLGLSFAFLCQLSLLFGPVAFMWMLLVVAAAISAAIGTLLSVARGDFKRASRMMVAFLGAAAIVPALVWAVFDTPYCVKRQARPAIEAVVAYAGNGPYPRNAPKAIFFPGEAVLPESVDAAVRATGCFYSGDRDPSTFGITCDGIALSHHSYDHRTERWSTWD